jgi:hypothetical protein
MADACANNAVNRSRRLAGILNTKSFGGDSVTAAVLAIKPSREFPRAQRSGARARMGCNQQLKH